MKKESKIILLIILLLIGYGVYRLFYGPSVNLIKKIEIKGYVERYLSKKYGDHKFRVTGIDYTFDMTKIFDYSNPTGYMVYFNSDIVPDSFVTIDGLKSKDYKVRTDFFIEDYYFPSQESYEIQDTMNSIEPKEEIESIILNELQNEFEPDAYEVNYTNAYLDIPEDYGKIPSLEEIKTNTNLYKLRSFSYKVSNTIEDTDKYGERLKKYIINKYNSNSNIYISPDNTIVSVVLED